MYRITSKMSVLMAGVAFSAAALAVDAPSAPAVAAPAATVESSASLSKASVSAEAALAPAPAATIEASAPAPTAPVSADAALSPAASVAVAVEAAPKAEQKEPVLAQADALALLKKSNCLLCHSIEKKVVGPAYKDVAAKYRGQDVEAKLFAKVTTGGKGVWGSTAMPPQMANRDDIRSLIRFVLALPPTSIAKNN